MTPEAIRNALLELARSQGVRILWACESGSRAWGFASPDSDYDGRFLFVHPRERYTSPWQPAEEIRVDLPGDLDFSGWDIGKALRLCARSNASLLEWLQSPIVYEQADGFRNALFPLASGCFSPREGIRNYLGIARSAAKAFGPDQRIKIKKLFYILRPLLAAHWIVEKGSVPPMTFEELLVPLKVAERSALLAAIRRLEEAKRHAVEGELHLPEDILLEFIAEQDETSRKAYEAMSEDGPEQRQILETFFLESLGRWA